MTRSCTMILRAAVAVGLLLILAGTGIAATIPGVTILGAISNTLRAPGKMALDSSGNMYVADPQNRGIVTFDRYGKYSGRMDIRGVVRSVACTPDGRIIVSHGQDVTMYSRSGAAIHNLAGYSFGIPNGITIDSAGNIYVADSKANKIAVFTRAGKFSGAFGIPGTKPGQFNFPTAIAYEKVSNQLVVADTMNNRVQFFDTAGVFKSAIGTSSMLSGPLCFAYPQGIAFDYTSGVRMYVADSFQSSVQVIDIGAKPVFLTYIGSYGTAIGQLVLPFDVAFDADNRRLLVVDGTGIITLYGIDGGVNPVNPALPPAFLDPVPTMVTTPALTLGGHVAAGSSVSVVVGSGAPVAGSVSGTFWNAVVNLSPGENVITVTATAASGVTVSESVAVTYLTAAASTDTSSSGFPISIGGPGGGTDPWNFPAGTDCRHSRNGSITCR